MQSSPPAEIPTPQPTEAALPSKGDTEITATVAPTILIRKIAFVRNCSGNLGYEIFTADSDGSNIVDITNKPGDDLWPTWSPDGTKIAFQSSREWHGYPSIYTVDADGKNAKSLIPEVVASQFPSWSPDGTKIAYCTSKLSHNEKILPLDIFIMDVDGNNRNPVSPIIRSRDTTASQVCPSWFPDSKYIAFTSDIEGYWQLYSVNSDTDTGWEMHSTSSPVIKRYTTPYGSQFRPATRNLKPTDFPALAVSPDGREIAFDYCSSTPNKKGDIYILTIGDGELRNLTSSLRGNCYFPTWSPDGSKIAFTLETDSNMDTFEINGNTDIYIIDADGSNPTLLIDDGMFPSWQK